MPGEQRTDALRLRLIDQRQSLAQGGAGRLFDQHVFACSQGFLNQRKATLRRRAEGDRIHRRAVGEQLGQRLEVFDAGTGLALGGDRYQLESGIGVDCRYVLILGDFAVAHQTETDWLHQ